MQALDVWFGTELNDKNFIRVSLDSGFTLWFCWDVERGGEEEGNKNCFVVFVMFLCSLNKRPWWSQQRRMNEPGPEITPRRKIFKFSFFFSWISSEFSIEMEIYLWFWWDFIVISGMEKVPKKRILNINIIPQFFMFRLRFAIWTHKAKESEREILRRGWITPFRKVFHLTSSWKWKFLLFTSCFHVELRVTEVETVKMWNALELLFLDIFKATEKFNLWNFSLNANIFQPKLLSFAYFGLASNANDVIV